MLFVGDIMLDRSVRRQIEKAQDPLYPFVRIADTLRAADLTFGNLEGPVSSRGTNQGSIYSFRFEPVGTINALTYAGFDVVSSANNHIWDWGSEALSDTFTQLDEAGIGHAGAGRNYEEANGPFFATLGDPSAGSGQAIKIALLAFTNLYPCSLEATASTPGISSFDMAKVSETIRNLKGSGQACPSSLAPQRCGRADLAIVSFHWGTEYESLSTTTQQIIGRGLIDAGADLVIGHHPHVVQEVERYVSSVILSGVKDLDPSVTPQDDTGEPHVGYIVYSLGKFVFDQNLSRITMKGLMVEASIKNKKVESIKEIPIQLTPTFQPYIPGAPGDPALDTSG